MGLIQSAFLYFKRRYIQTILITSLLGLIVLGECIGLLLYGTSVQAEKDAYVYNGAAIYFEGENLSLTREDYNQIEQLDYVEGVDLWSEIRVTPVDTENVKTHTGTDPIEGDQNDRGVGDDMIILAQMDIPLMDAFRWEASVSVLDGTYADYENQGIMVESRYAEQNSLSVGDSVTFYSESTETEADLVICGIYRVETDFEILDSNTEGTSVYIHSPYNTIYMDYYAAQELLGIDTTPSETGAELYVDEINHVNAVAEELQQLLGEDIDVYDNTTAYLEDECRIVGLMRKMSQIICTMVFVLGFLMVLLVLSLFSEQYKAENGKLLVLGYSRRWCVARFLWITLLYVIGGAIFGIFLYLIGGNLISSLIGDVSMNVISDSIYFVTGGYTTPNFNQGFAVTVSTSAVFAPKYLAVLAGVLMAGWLITLLLPLHAVFTSRPRKLLESNHG